MSWSVFASTFVLIFVAELGDKTQLTAIALATRFSCRKAFAGIALAFVCLNLAAVAVGQVLFELIPLGYVKLAAAVLFLVFGVLSLRHEPEEAEAREQREADAIAAGKKPRGPMLTSFLLILFAELGDKTQLATAGLAAEQPHPIAVFVGSTLALWLVSLLGLLAGAQLARRIPLKYVHRAAAGLFIACGLVTLYQAWRALHPLA